MYTEAKVDVHLVLTKDEANYLLELLNTVSGRTHQRVLGGKGKEFLRSIADHFYDLRVLDA